ncbi:hypothetical protein [Haliovirga abyssi]|uniref:Uncharacterized protein n=1 Tax=Haliovirga abyssi TaxID=2996794 RepID=A0AAU9D9R8_9FUSO|nr:hypothetical protein [Haliovirga abyssi]BDU51378.1 hypothetical protein HLVA_19470 [Haliovirga abyssi]
MRKLKSSKPKVKKKDKFESDNNTTNHNTNSFIPNKNSRSNQINPATLNHKGSKRG